MTQLPIIWRFKCSEILLRVDWWSGRSGIQKHIHHQQPLCEKVRISPCVPWSLELLMSSLRRVWISVSNFTILFQRTQIENLGRAKGQFLILKVGKVNCGTRRGWVVSNTPRPHFTPGKTRYPFYRRLGGPQGPSGRAENLVATGIRTRIVQPLVSRYTDWAAGAIVYVYTVCN